MKRERFSYRRTTTKKRKNLSASESIQAITNFFLDTRVYQQTVPDLPLTRVYNRDQVPMALAAQYATTIEDKNKDVIWDSTYDSSDVKRFSTLNLTITMEVQEDLGNIIKPHLVFKATRFAREDD